MDYFAPSGLGLEGRRHNRRALAWAGLFCPFRAVRDRIAFCQGPIIPAAGSFTDPLRTNTMTYAASLLLATVGCAAGASASELPCACPANQVRGGWCDACDVGYVASVRIESRELFEAIDAHGHDVNPSSFRCESCKEAIKSDGFCRDCKVGFVGQQAYFSRLTYLLAKGAVTPPGSMTCDECRKHIQEPGWCAKCDVGMVGHVAYRDKARFTEAVKAYEALRKAIRTADECPSCAIAIAVDRTCRRCKKSYEGGEIVRPKKSPD